MSNLVPGEFDVGGVRGKRVSLSHLAIPVLDVERSIAFYEKYLQMKVVNAARTRWTCGWPTASGRSSWSSWLLTRRI